MGSQSIKLDSKLRKLVVSGQKTRTMRSGLRGYIPGPACFEIVEAGVDTGESIPIEIQQVEVKTFEAITDDDAHHEGYELASELKEALLHYYPTLSGDDPVTVVSFRLEEAQMSTPSTGSKKTPMQTVIEALRPQVKQGTRMLEIRDELIKKGVTPK